MDEEDIDKYSIKDIDNIISDYKTQFDSIKKNSIEQTTKTRKKFDLNEQLQKENDKQAQYIKTLKHQIATQQSELASIEEKAASINNEIMTLNTTIKDKAKEYQDKINSNTSSHEGSMEALTLRYQETETALNKTINTQANTISELNNTLLKCNQIKERIIQLHSDNSPLMIKSNSIKDNETIKEEEEKENKMKQEKPLITDDDICEMINDIKNFMTQLIEDNKHMYNEIIQYKKRQEDQQEMKESEQVKELRYENAMIKQQLNQLVNENVKQIAKEKNQIYFEKASEDDYLTKEIRYKRQANTINTQLSSNNGEIDPIKRLKAKINDLEIRLRSKKESQETEY